MVCADDDNDSKGFYGKISAVSMCGVGVLSLMYVGEKDKSRIISQHNDDAMKDQNLRKCKHIIRKDLTGRNYGWLNATYREWIMIQRKFSYVVKKLFLTSSIQNGKKAKKV